jgi:hypothetical protein
MGTTPFEKTLRTNGTSTPRNKLNNRYGPVGTGSRGPIDADELDGSPVQGDSSPAVGRNTTPRSAGRYGSPFGQTVRVKRICSCSVARGCCLVRLC